VLGRLRFGSFTCPLIVATASRITWPKRRDAKLAGRELFGFRKPGGPLFVMTTMNLGLLSARASSSGNDLPERPFELRLHGVWMPDYHAREVAGVLP
jgi:hypothetical protein